VLGHAKEQGPTTGRRVWLGANVVKWFVTDKRGMGAREGVEVAGPG